MCKVSDSIGYCPFEDLRRCYEHRHLVFYDKDYGCMLCKANAGAEKSDSPTAEQALDNKIDELEGRAKEIIEARAERLLEKTGDHGRPDHGGTNGGMRWL